MAIALIGWAARCREIEVTTDTSSLSAMHGSPWYLSNSSEAPSLWVSVRPVFNPLPVQAANKRQQIRCFLSRQVGKHSVRHQ